ncbi:MAG: LEPR-XLL domain-containing protein, partial [Halioglobus sp.]
MTKLPSVVAQRWLNNYLNRPQRSVLVPEEKALNEMAAAFRLEALEPRLLLSADPVLGELARWVEDDSGKDSEALSAIIQEMNEAAQAELLSGTEAESVERADIAVSWPQAWSESAGDAHEDEHFLRAEGTPSLADGVGNIEQGQAVTALAAAKLRFADLGLDFDETELADITIVAGDLSAEGSDVIAKTNGNVITVDFNAAGFGWYLDPNYADDDEFDEAGGDDATGIDLLSTIMHEIGHVVLGGDHAGADSPDTLMSATISEGERQIAVTLNNVIDSVLANFDGAVPTGGTFTYSTAADQTVVIGTTLDGGRDLELDDLTLSFSDLVFDGSAWSGIVVVEAASGVLLSSVLDVELTDTDDDGNAVVGTIVLGTSTASELDIDSVNVFDSNPDLLTIPSLLSVDITGIKLSFNDFRGNANDNTLDLAVGVTGLKGVIPIELKDKFNLEVVGSFRVAIELDDLEGSAGKAADLLDAFAAVELTGLSLEASGALEGVGTFKKVGVSYKSVVNADDPDDPIDLFTLSGDITLGPKLLGKDKDDKDITKNVSFAFAFSELGPLDAFIGSSTESIAIQGQGYQIKVNGFGLVFNNTIEGRQTSADFDVVNLSVPDYNNGTVTIEIAANDHDLNKDGEFDDVDALKVDDEIRIRNSSNGMLNGLWKVTAVGDGTVTFAVDSDPGTLIGETAGAIVIRHNIREPEDLLDPGFANGIAPPASLADWQAVLEDSVATQVANDDTWGSFSGQFILGAKANVEFRDRIQEEAGTGIAPEILGGKLDFLIDSELNLLVLGNLSVYEGKVVLPAKLFASVDLDLSDSNDPPGVEANFLLNAQLNAGPVLPVTEATKEINAEISAPLVEINAAVSFAYADNEFSIKARGQFDLNVPGDLTTITLEGGAELIFTVAGTLEDPAIDVEFTFGAYLSEEFVGQIGEANGAFKVTISDAGASIYGAAIVTVDDFLSDYGVEFAAEGTFLINTTQAEKTVDIFKRDDNNELTEEKLLSKTITKDQTIAMALVGSAELRIGDVDLLEIQGGFGLQIGKAGVSVGVFADPDAPDPEGTNSATIDVLDIVEGSVSGFFAIVTGEDGDGVPGVAGRLSITARAELEVAETTFATIGGGALMVFNTTGREVEFTPPVENPQTMVVAAGAPSTDLVKNTLEDPRLPQADKFDELSTGTITNVAQISSEWAVEEESAYAVLWLAATGEDDGINIFNGVITGDATASILVSSDGAFALDTRFFLAGDFLGLADGYVGGLLSLTSEADADFISAFAVNLAAGVQLGPDWLNVSGDASIYISYDDTRTTERLEASGTVSAAVNVDIGIVDVSIGASLDIIYEEGELKFGVTYPEPFIDRSCWDTFLGDVCVYYPNIRDAQFVFSVGEFDIFGPGGNPPKLGQVDTNGVLTLNVGEGTGEGTAASRYLEMGDINEIVSIGALTAEQDGAQDIAVSMFGLTQEFKGVKEIRIGDMGNGNDAVYIEAVSDNRVEMVTDLTVTLGDGADLLRNDGAGMVTAHGGKGADELFGGSGIDNLYGGDDNDRISGGGGRDTLEGGGDDDIMIWLAGDGEDIKIDGGAGTGDLLQVGRDDGAALVATVNPNAANSKAFDVSVVGQPTLTAAGVEGLNVIGTDQADTLTVNSLIGNELNRITVDFGEDSAQDELIVNTTGTADTVTLDVEVPGAAAENTENLTQPVQPDENNPNPAINDVLAGVSIPVPDTTSEVAVEGSVSVGAYGTGSSDLITVNTGDGEDVVNVAATLSEITTTINAGDGGDDITVGSEGITVGSEGITDRVDGLVVVNAGDDGSTDKLAVSDASSTGGKRGDLTATMLTGLGMATGVNYTEVEELTITLGSGADTLLVDSTHGASTEINAGNGSASQRDDTIAINTISGETTVHGEGGADAVLVNVADNGSGGFARTFANGIDATLKIHGEGGGDDVTVNLAGEGSALINVLDNGDVGDGVDTLTINGTENVDNILMRADTVALLNGGTDGTGTAERVNYNTDINDDNGI